MLLDIVPMDSSDPAVAFLALMLMELLKLLLRPAALKRIAPAIPALVVLLALGIRVTYDAFLSDGGQVTAATALRALAAGAVAVMSHAQFRSVVKAMTAADSTETPDRG